MTQRIEPFFSTWLTEIEPFFSTCLKVLTYPFWKRWLKELNLFFQFDSKNWTSFSNLTQRIEHLSNFTQRIELFPNWLKELNLKRQMTQKIEALELIWLKELNLFLWTWLKDFVLRIWLKELFFFTITPRIGPLTYDSKNCF